MTKKQDLSMEFIHESDQLITLCSKFQAIATGDLTESLVEAKRESLNDKWLELKACFKKTCMAEDKEVSEDLKESVRAKFETCSDAYDNAKAKMNEVLKTLKAKSTTAQIANESMSFSNVQNSTRRETSCIKVPPCDTEIFYGSYEEWPSFRDMFTAVYSNHPELTSAQKLYHLRNKTKGLAGGIFKKYSLSDENFSLAWEALKTRFENKRILVDNQLKILFNITPIRTECAQALQKLLFTINDCLALLKSQGVSTTDWDPIIIYLCSSKLPEETLALWEQSLKSSRDLPSWKELDEFLSKRLEVVERVSTFKHEKNSSKPTVSLQSFLTENRDSPSCKLCTQTHALRQCPNFLQLSVEERIKFVTDNQFCNNCLAYSHIKRDCKSRYKCFYCKKSHNTLLHLATLGEARTSGTIQTVNGNNSARNRNVGSDLIDDPGDEQPTSSKQAMVNRLQSYFVYNKEMTILPTALVNIQHAGETYTLRALIDQGSQKTFLSEKTQRKLRIPTQKSSFQISGMGDTFVQTASKVAHIVITPKTKDQPIHAQAIVLSKLTSLLPSYTLTIPDISQISELDLADPNFYKPAQVDLVLGCDVIPLIMRDGLRTNVLGSLMAQNTVFGWYLCGPLTCNPIRSFTTQCTQNEDINELLKKFWELEEVPQSKDTSEIDQHCEELYTATTMRQTNGKYVVKLPFKEDFPTQLTLKSSRNIAVSQYLRMESSLRKTPMQKSLYDTVLNEYIALGHMVEVPSVEISENGCYKSFYLPHHAVLKPDSTTTKLRVVFNASRKSQNGPSLNDILHTGPALQNDLVFIIINWRFYRYVFNGDIEKMYRQILVSESDRPFQRILFRPIPNQPIKDFELQTVTFGVNCAPYLAIRTLHQLASDVEEDYPTAASILRRDTYVDDILSGGHTLEEAIQTRKELVDVLNSACFPLKKITANHIDLLKGVPESHLLNSNFLKFSDSSSTKTLGIRWNAETDSFTYSLSTPLQLEPLTKRKILSTIAKLFDPAGWLSPIIIQAKILLQQVWQEGTDWDELVTKVTQERWERFVNTLFSINKVEIPRWISFSPGKAVQVHGFCDASEQAYCACIYIRCQAQETSSHLLVAKSKVAPLQTISLPRLELCAAVMLSKLVRQVIPKLKFEIKEMMLWTDSAIVLAWLQKPPYTWKTYVANRVSQILSNVSNATWKHVQSAQNPADLATRISDSEDLQVNKLWWHGPEWLSKSPDSWPVSNLPQVTVTEVRRVNAFNTFEDNGNILSLFSSYPRALRVIAYVFRYLHLGLKRHRTHFHYTSKSITFKERDFVKQRLILLEQRAFYPKEYADLENSREISKKSSLLTLNPFLDERGLLRVNGRLTQASLSYDERCPIILPANSSLCTLFLKFLHEELLHAELSLMSRIVRSQFYIPRMKSQLKKCINNCKTCVIYKHQLRSQIMAALPETRTTLSPPFSVVGVDFAGPFNLKSSNLRNAPYLKGYACIFVCFSTKAVHLETCSDLTSECFIAAFTRFVGRRGLPHTVVSDNGSNFVGASRTLTKQYADFLQIASNELLVKYTAHNFRWKHIPPNAPHMGGLWESAVKSFKIHFKKVAGTHKFTFEEFSTLLARIEGVLNSRPLVPMSDNPLDLAPLTPGHFLRGSPLIAFPEPFDQDISIINRWEKVKRIHHELAIRWKEEYLKSLHRRYKWKRPQSNIEVNDLVVIKDDDLPPQEWRLGRILQVHAGNDSNIRVADVRTQKGTVTRPIVKLCVLPKDP